MPRSVVRVVCTLRLTIATLAPTSVLTSVDLPALGAPITAMKPQRVSPAGPVGSSDICDIRAPLPYSFARQQRRGRSLLGGALARALAARGLAALDAHLGREDRRVVRALAVDLDVVGQLQALALHPLLQQRLGISRLRRRAPEPARPV